MWPFSNTTKVYIKSEDYQAISNRIADINAEIKVIQAELRGIITNINSINGRVNKTKRQEEQEENIKSDLSFPFRGA
jgi:hypothetical protein